MKVNKENPITAQNKCCNMLHETFERKMRYW